MQHVFARSLSLLLFSLIALVVFASFPVPASACECYDTSGRSFSADGTSACIDACENPDAFETDVAGVCTCPETEFTPESSAEIDCAEVCLDAGGTVDSPALTGVVESKPITIPNLGVAIPGVNFAATLNDQGLLESNFIAAYVSGVYRYLLSISVTIAIVMVMIGGVQYVIGGGAQEQVSKGKERIVNAVTGLILLLSVFVILYTVNPQLTVLNTLAIKTVKPSPITIGQINDNLQDCPDVKGLVRRCSVNKMVNPGGRWTDELVDAINKVAAEKNVDAILLATHLQKETAGDANWGQKIGPCGEIGPAQFMPYTFDAVVSGQPQCCINYGNSSGSPESGMRGCATVTPNWPPDGFDPDHCQTTRPDGSGESYCGNCAIAAQSCIDYFDTSITLGGKTGIERVVEAQADFVLQVMASTKVNGDIALEMCAYNGSGSGAAQYAKSAAAIYQGFCAQAGGTQ